MQIKFNKEEFENLASSHSVTEMAEKLSEMKGVKVSENIVRKGLKAFGLTAKTKRDKFVFEDNINNTNNSIE